MGFEPIFSQHKLYYEDLSNGNKDSVILNTNEFEGSIKTATAKGDSVFLFCDKVYVSGDKGQSWVESTEIDQIFEDLVFEYDPIGTTDLITKKNLVIASKAFKVANAGNKIFHMLSRDNGSTWQLIGYGDLLFDRSQIYIQRYNTIYSFDEENSQLVETDFYLPARGYYRYDEETEYYLNYEKKGHYSRAIGTTEWQKSEEIYKFMDVTPDGRKYRIDLENKLFIEDGDEIIDLKENAKYCSILERLPNNIEVLLYSDLSDLHKYAGIIVLKNNQIIKELKADSYEYVYAGIDKANYDIVYHFYYNEISKLNYYVRDNYMTGDLDTVQIDKYLLQEDQGQKIQVIGDNIYIVSGSHASCSDDGGITRFGKQLPNTYLDSKGYGFTIYKNELYITGANGLHHQSKGEWKNLLDGITDAYVYDVEFFNDKVYAYTEDGVFISDAPTSVEDQVLKESLDYDLYPNPCSDNLNINFAGKIDKLEIIDLFGNRFESKSTFNQVDVSGLPSGSYFLKILTDGKTIAKQFVVAR